MRILQVIPTLSKGGAEAVVVDLSNSLSQIGHQITALVGYPVIEAESRANSLGAEVQLRYISTVRSGRLQKYLSTMRFIVKNRRYIKDFDVVHCHLSLGQFFGFFWRIITLFQSGKEPRLIYTCHNVGANNPRWQSPLDKLSTRIFDAFVLMAQDETWKTFAARHNKMNLFFIENGISYSPEMKVDRFEHWVTRPLTIGTISRLQVERRPWRFLEVFASLHKMTEREFRFIIGGDGPLIPQLESQSLEFGLEGQITFPGIVLDPKEFLDSIDIYLTLNTESTTGIAGLEAVFSGIPVVALQSLPNYIATKEDWIWSSSDPTEVAAMIKEIAFDRTQAIAIATFQQSIGFERFNAESMTYKYVEVYQSEIVSNRIYDVMEIHQIKKR